MHIFEYYMKSNLSKENKIVDAGPDCHSQGLMMRLAIGKTKQWTLACKVGFLTFLPRACNVDATKFINFMLFLVHVERSFQSFQPASISQTQDRPPLI